MPVVISGSTGIQDVDGSAGTPALTGATSSTAGAFFPAANTVAWSTASTERMRIDSSGNVGIGTSSPNGSLTINKVNLTNGTLFLNGATTGADFMRLKNTSADGIFGIAGSVGTEIVSGGLPYATQIYTVGSTALQLGTASNVRATIDSSGNVGIGTSSPSYKLDIVDAGGNSFRVTKSTTQFGAYVSGSTPFLGSISNNDFAFITNSTERMRIDTSGNVGIGTSSPGSKLDVSSSTNNIIVSRSTGSFAAFQRIAPTGQQTYDFYTINGVEAGRITVDGSNYMAFATGSSAAERMRIDSSGNVGIGYSSPGQRLSVSGGFEVVGSATLPAALGSGVISYESPNTRCYVGDGTGYSWRFSKRASSTTTDLVTFLDSGNVGIGTSSPGAKLDVRTSLSATSNPQWISDFYAITSGATNSTYGGGIRLYTQNPNGNYWPAAIAALNDAGGSNLSSLAFYTATSGPTLNERARIDSSGNLLVGTTAAISSTNPGFYYEPNGALSLGRTGTGTVAAVYFYNGNGVVGQINTSGTSTAYVTSSDYRLKENVKPMTDGLATVAALKPVRYDWISDKSAGEGFIAHELQAVIPQAVTGEKDAVDENGKPIHQGVDYSKIVVHLVAAIQELSAKVAALEGKA